MDDASLEDFLDSGEDADDESTTDADDDSAAEAADADEDTAADSTASTDEDEAAVEPATTTYQWTPTGATCAVCGDQTERRWHSDEGLVCPDCKEW